jgi:hypothetical protein
LLAVFALLVAFVVVGTAGWLARPGPVAMFTFVTSDDLSTLHYSCRSAESEAATLALAQQAHAAFEAEMPAVVETAAGSFHDTMTTTRSISDLKAIKAVMEDELNELIAGSERRFGCALTRETPR